MIFFYNKKRREKPRYKKLIKARENALNKKKILQLKKKKWKTFQFYYEKKLKYYNKYKVLDQKIYTVIRKAKRGTAYKKRYRDTLTAVRNFKLFYGSSKKYYFKNLIKTTLKEFKKKKINLNAFFLSKIESRLDVVLFRSKCCWTINLSRQLIKHGKIKVNNKIIKSKFYILKPGDFINIDKQMFFELNEINKELSIKDNVWPQIPNHLFVNHKTLQIVFGDPMNKSFANSLTFNLKLEKILLNYLKTQ